MLTQVVLSHSGRMLFVATNSGAVRAVKFPLTDPADWNEHQAHTAAVTRVSIIIIYTHTMYVHVYAQMYLLIVHCVRACFILSCCSVLMIPSSFSSSSSYTFFYLSSSTLTTSVLYCFTKLLLLLFPSPAPHFL